MAPPRSPTSLLGQLTPPALLFSCATKKQGLRCRRLQLPTPHIRPLSWPHLAGEIVHLPFLLHRAPNDYLSLSTSVTCLPYVIRCVRNRWGQWLFAGPETYPCFLLSTINYKFCPQIVDDTGRAFSLNCDRDPGGRALPAECNPKRVIACIVACMQTTEMSGGWTTTTRPLQGATVWVDNGLEVWVVLFGGTFRGELVRP